MSAFNKSVADAVHVTCTDDELIVTLVDGRRVAAPLGGFHACCARLPLSE